MEIKSGKISKGDIYEFIAKEDSHLNCKFKCDRYFYDDFQEVNLKDLPLLTLLTIDVDKLEYEYEYIFFVDLCKNENEVLFLFELSYSMKEWREDINVMSFREHFSEITDGFARIQFTSATLPFEACRSALNTTSGCLKPRHFLGLAFSFLSI